MSPEEKGTLGYISSVSKRRTNLDFKLHQAHFLSSPLPSFSNPAILTALACVSLPLGWYYLSWCNFIVHDTGIKTTSILDNGGKRRRSKRKPRPCEWATVLRFRLQFLVVFLLIRISRNTKNLPVKIPLRSTFSKLSKVPGYLNFFSFKSNGPYVVTLICWHETKSQHMISISSSCLLIIIFKRDILLNRIYIYLSRYIQSFTWSGRGNRTLAILER